jgi:hypothetical protein
MGRSELRQYERPQRYALSELAPGNTFYINRDRHEITGLEIGTVEDPAWLTWRVRLGCGHIRTENAESDCSVCPRRRTGDIDDGSCLSWSSGPSRPRATSGRTSRSAMTRTAATRGTTNLAARIVLDLSETPGRLIPWMPQHAAEGCPANARFEHGCGNHSFE